MITRKFIMRDVSRHGQVRYYFRKAGGPRIRLPDQYMSAEFIKRYDHLFIGGTPDWNPKALLTAKVKMAGLNKQKIERSLMRAIARARRLMRAKGLPCDLSLDWALNQIELQDFRCALTGIRFFAKERNETNYVPYAPSLDQIRPGQGYTTANVRIVLVAVNIMLSDWGEDVFTHITNCYRNFGEGKRRQFSPSASHLEARQ